MEQSVRSQKIPPYSFRKEYDAGDMTKYKAIGVCAFVEEYSELCHAGYSRVIEL